LRGTQTKRTIEWQDRQLLQNPRLLAKKEEKVPPTTGHDAHATGKRTTRVKGLKRNNQDQGD